MKTNTFIFVPKFILIAYACLFNGQMANAEGQISCNRVHGTGARVDKGPAFLNQKYSNLATSKPVTVTTENIRSATGKTLQKPTDKISAWLQYMELASQNDVTG